MKQQILTPGMEQRREANLRSQASWIRSEREQRLGRRPEEQIVELPLIVQHQRLQRLGQREHHVEILDRQEPLEPSFEPGSPLRALALGTVTVSARVVRDTLVTAIPASVDMATEHGGAASGQATQHARLRERNPM